MNEEGWKRDILPAIDDMSTAFNTSVWHAGILDVVDALHPELDNSTSTGPRHVWGFKAPHGGDMHVTWMGNHSVTGKHMFRFGFGNGLLSNSSSLSPISNITTRYSPQHNKRETYQSQYFTSGGIDYIAESDGYEGSKGNFLDPKNDYVHIYNQVSCQFTGKNDDHQKAAGSYMQLYDNIAGDTIVEGSLAPFAPSTHWSAISQMWKVPVPVIWREGCEGVE